MKHLIMWGGLLVACIILALIYQKVSVATMFFDESNSPIYADIIFFGGGLLLVITRGTALIGKLF